ncbi:hypothetical protein GYMLUDRAFT_116817, partial [Collybiopsis luxurians FD-317 M1]
LDVPPETELEEKLQHALCHLQHKYTTLKEQALVMQSTMVLNGAYCLCLREQLAAQEESQSRTKGKLMGNGLPKLLTSEAFVKWVEEF